MNKHKPNAIIIEAEHIHGAELTPSEIMAICAMEKRKIHDRAERISADNPNVPDEAVIMIVMERVFKAYKFN